MVTSELTTAAVGVVRVRSGLVAYPAASRVELTASSTPPPIPMTAPPSISTTPASSDTTRANVAPAPGRGGGGGAAGADGEIHGATMPLPGGGGPSGSTGSSPPWSRRNGG